MLAANPFRERLCGQLMRALCRSGRQVDALSLYTATRRRMDDEFGLEARSRARRTRGGHPSARPHFDRDPYARDPDGERGEQGPTGVCVSPTSRRRSAAGRGIRGGDDDVQRLSPALAGGGRAVDLESRAVPGGPAAVAK
ncbi:BTAD domain-containing putative transcriptional regulator [Kribbella deserti]|uniref:BTAD domain-containing putative transcriptional regulator n=1 Tax=Kribbella deserti TaxID=1926257 RepID=A0ABV6QMZ0_9ACTN